MTKEKSIGQKIFERRMELGWSAESLGERVGKDRATVYRYENGDIKNMPLSILMPLAKALQVSPSWLLGETDVCNECITTCHKKIGDRISERRIELGMSQQQLASKVGYSSNTTINKIEKGTRDFPRYLVTRFAVALEVPVSYLLEEDTPEDRQLQFNEEELKKEEILEEKSMAKKSKEWLTDAEVEAEIEALKDSEYIKLARKEIRLIYKRRQVLYQLRNLEKRGKELASQGYTIDNIGKKMFGGLEDDGEEA